MKLDDSEKALYRIHSGGQNRERSIISESGLYKLVMRSDKPQAKPFQDWVTREVLPSIRKTGSYSLKHEPQQLCALKIDQGD